MIDEAALRRPVGGVDSMRDQLHYLAKMEVLGTVSIAILPFSPARTSAYLAPSTSWSSPTWPITASWHGVPGVGRRLRREPGALQRIVARRATIATTSPT